MIEFDSKNVELPKLNDALLSLWIEQVAAYHNRRVGHISYLFCDDNEILDVNRRFLNHDYYTDVITFDYTRGSKIGGDIVISLDTIASNAAGLGVPYEREFNRVVIHGVLHLCGINDKGPGEREIMEREEDRALAMLDALSRDV